MNALDLIDGELQRAAAPKSSGKPIFLFLKENHKAVIRPLFDLKSAIVLKKHNKWSDNPEQRVNAICASEVGKPCVYCQKAVDDKKLTPQLQFYLPVHVLGVIDQSTGDKVTFEEKTEDGGKVTKPVQGIRLLELAAFGTIGQVLKAFREFMKEDENPPIIGCDFNLSQSGSGQKKTFVLMPKMPKAMPEQLQEMLKQDNFKPASIKEKILQALPPVSSEEKADPFVDEAPLQGGHKEEIAFDESIPDF